MFIFLQPLRFAVQTLRVFPSGYVSHKDMKEIATEENTRLVGYVVVKYLSTSQLENRGGGKKGDLFLQRHSFPQQTFHELFNDDVTVYYPLSLSLRTWRNLD
jgi:hypothetical protein